VVAVSIENAEQNRAWETATSAFNRYTALDRQYIGGVISECARDHWDIVRHERIPYLL
jgi:hypothetical protein